MRRQALGGVDLAKKVFRLHGVDRQGQAVWRRRLRRGQRLKERRSPSHCYWLSAETAGASLAAGAIHALNNS
jgi:hypothetical protein